ncbi:MAG: hypothetical protein V4722_20340 [Bacteroidota bacterium]
MQFSVTNITGAAQVSPISNSWFFTPGQTESGVKGLIDYLDPDHTWMNKVSGGYINDLMLASAGGFDIALNSGQQKSVTSSMLLVKNDAGQLREQENYLYRILGLKLNANPGNAKVFLTVTSPAPGDAYLLYGTYAGSLGNASDVTGFQENGWDLNGAANNGFPHFSPRDRLGSKVPDMSTNFRQSAINLMATRLKGFAVGASGYVAPIEISLFRQHDGIAQPCTIQALGIPQWVPVNAQQLFEPQRLVTVWPSKKYRVPKVLSSEQLFINSLTVSQYVENSIATGNNGGYLNLVNPNFLTKTIRTSYRAANDDEDNIIRFNIDVANKLSSVFYYRIWMDFFPDTDANNYYNFVTGPTPHAIELLDAGSRAGSFTTDVRMPDNAS